MPRTDLKRRLQTLEAKMPTAADEERQQTDTLWRAILDHPNVADLLLLLDRVAVLVEQGYSKDGPEVYELLQQVADIMNAAEVDPAPERMHR